MARGQRPHPVRRSGAAHGPNDDQALVRLFGMWRAGLVFRLFDRGNCPQLVRDVRIMSVATPAAPAGTVDRRRESSRDCQFGPLFQQCRDAFLGHLCLAEVDRQERRQFGERGQVLIGDPRLAQFQFLEFWK